MSAPEDHPPTDRFNAETGLWEFFSIIADKWVPITSTPVSTAQLLNERGKTHGDFKHHADTTQMLKTVQREKQVKRLSAVQQEAVDMILHKLGRIAAGDPDFRDHWDDIAGYAKLAADRCTK